MRYVALVLGVVAGVFVFLGPVMPQGGPLPQFQQMWTAGGGAPAVGFALWYAVPGLALLGGALALFTPAASAVLLMVAGLAWLAIGMVLPQAPDLRLLIPGAATLLGALAALFDRALTTSRRPQAQRQPEPVRWEEDDAREGGGRTWLVLATALVLLVGAGAIAFAIFSNGQGRPVAAAQVGQAVPGNAAEAAAPAVPPAAAPATIAVPVAAVRDAAVGLPRGPLGAFATVPPPAAPTGELYDDPFAYCRAVGTIDYVDGRYAGPATIAPITQALRLPPEASRDRVRWRCLEGQVVACTSYGGPVCDMTPSLSEMRAFCRQNQTVAMLLAPNGTWSCANGEPRLPEGASWPVDDRGFMPRAWVVVPGPAVAQ